MAQIQEKHAVPHSWIFWLVVGIIVFGCIYILATTFCHIPKENIRFADTYQGFILGTMITTAMGYYLVSSPSRRGDAPQATGDNVTVTTTTTATDDENIQK